MSNNKKIVPASKFSSTKRRSIDEQATEISNDVVEILNAANAGVSPLRQVTLKSASTVVWRALNETRHVSAYSLRRQYALSQLSDFIDLTQGYIVNSAIAKYSDLLSVHHPYSAAPHKMDPTALTNAQMQWYLSDPRVTEDNAPLLASAFSDASSEEEKTYALIRLNASKDGILALEAITAAFGGDGNSYFARRMRAMRQRRDRLGQFAEEGGGMRALVKIINGLKSENRWLTGRTLATDPNTNTFDIETPKGIVRVPAGSAEGIKAYIPSETVNGYSPVPAKVSIADEKDIILEKNLQFIDSPAGWEPIDSFQGQPGEKGYTDGVYTIAVAKNEDGSTATTRLIDEDGNQVSSGTSWAQMLEDSLTDANGGQKQDWSALPEDMVLEGLDDIARNSSPEATGLAKVAGQITEYLRTGTLPEGMTHGELTDRVASIAEHLFDARTDRKSSWGRFVGMEDDFRGGLEAMQKKDQGASEQQKRNVAPTPTPTKTEEVTPEVKTVTPATPQSNAIEFTVPEGAHDLDTGEFTPDLNSENDIADFTEDPKTLANKFSTDKLQTALKEALIGREYTPTNLVEPTAPKGDKPSDAEMRKYEEDYKAYEEALKEGTKVTSDGFGLLDFNDGSDYVPAEALYHALKERGAPADEIVAGIYDTALGTNENMDKISGAEGKTPATNDLADVAETKIKTSKGEVTPVETKQPIEDVTTAEEDSASNDTSELPALIEGLTDEEKQSWIDGGHDHNPFLPANKAIDLPDGYYQMDNNPVSPSDYVMVQEGDDLNQAGLPVGWTNNPYTLAKDVESYDLIDSLEYALEPRTSDTGYTPGYAPMYYTNADGERKSIEVKAEIFRDALQLQGEDTNEILQEVADRAWGAESNNGEIASDVKDGQSSGDLSPEEMKKMEDGEGITDETVIDGEVPAEVTPASKAPEASTAKPQEGVSFINETTKDANGGDYGIEVRYENAPKGHPRYNPQFFDDHYEIQVTLPDGSKVITNVVDSQELLDRTLQELKDRISKNGSEENSRWINKIGDAPQEGKSLFSPSSASKAPVTDLSSVYGLEPKPEGGPRSLGGDKVTSISSQGHWKYSVDKGWELTEEGKKIVADAQKASDSLRKASDLRVGEMTPLLDLEVGDFIDPEEWLDADEIPAGLSHWKITYFEADRDLQEDVDGVVAQVSAVISAMDSQGNEVGFDVSGFLSPNNYTVFNTPITTPTSSDNSSVVDDYIGTTDAQKRAEGNVKRHIGDTPAQMKADRIKTKDLKPGDVTIGDNFTLVEAPTEADETGRLFVRGYFPGGPVQEKRWFPNAGINVVRGMHPDQLPKQGDLPEIHQPKIEDYEGGKDNQEYQLALAIWRGRLNSARNRWDAPAIATKDFNPDVDPHRIKVSMNTIRPGDIVSDPARGHFTVISTSKPTNPDAIERGLVSITGYYPGHEIQTRNLKGTTEAEVIRNAELPAQGPLQAIESPLNTPEAKAQHAKELATAAALFDVPQNIPFYDLGDASNTPDISNNPAPAVKDAGKKPRDPFYPDDPFAQGEMAGLVRQAGGDWAKLKELLADKTLVFFDYETTGLNPNDGDNPVQMGAVKVVNGEIVDRFNVYMNPGDAKLSEYSLDTLKDSEGNPISKEFLDQQMSMDDAHQQFADWAGKDAILGAHKSDFDRQFLEKMLTNGGIDFTPAGYINTLEMARAINADDPNAPIYPEGHKRAGKSDNTLGTLSKHFGFPVGDGWHNADVDSEATAKLFQALLDKAIKENSGKNLFDIDGAQRKFDAGMARYNAQVSELNAWNAVNDALQGKEVDVDKLIDDTSKGSSGTINPDELQPPSGSKNPVVDDVPVNPLRLATEEWALDPANTREIPRSAKEVNFENIKPGDFMTSSNGNIYQVLAVKAGEEGGLLPSEASVYRVRVGSGENGHWFTQKRGLYPDGLRRPINIDSLALGDDKGDSTLKPVPNEANNTAGKPTVFSTERYSESDKTRYTAETTVAREEDGALIATTEITDSEGNVVSTSSQQLANVEDAELFGKDELDSFISIQSDLASSQEVKDAVNEESTTEIDPEIDWADAMPIKVTTTTKTGPDGTVYHASIIMHPDSEKFEIGIFYVDENGERQEVEYASNMSLYGRLGDAKKAIGGFFKSIGMDENKKSAPKPVESKQDKADKEHSRVKPGARLDYREVEGEDGMTHEELFWVNTDGSHATYDPTDPKQGVVEVGAIYGNKHVRVIKDAQDARNQLSKIDISSTEDDVQIYLHADNAVGGRALRPYGTIDRKNVTDFEGRELTVEIQRSNTLDGYNDQFVVIVRDPKDDNRELYVEGSGSFVDANALYQSLSESLENGDIKYKEDINYGKDFRDVVPTGESARISVEEFLPGSKPEVVRMLGDKDFQLWREQNYIYADAVEQARLGDRVMVFWHKSSGSKVELEGTVVGWETIHNLGDRRREGYAFVVFADGTEGTFSTDMMSLKGRMPGTESDERHNPPVKEGVKTQRPLSNVERGWVNKPKLDKNGKVMRDAKGKVLMDYNYATEKFAVSNRYKIQERGSEDGPRFPKIIPYVSTNERNLNREESVDATRTAIKLWNERIQRVNAWRAEQGLPPLADVYTKIATPGRKDFVPVWEEAIKGTHLDPNAFGDISNKINESVDSIVEEINNPDAPEQRFNMAFPTAEEIEASKSSKPKRPAKSSYSDEEREAYNEQKVQGIQDALVQKILDDLENGVAPWESGWTGEGNFFPTNVTTGKRYNGSNIFILQMAQAMGGYSTNQWATVKQIEKAYPKANIRKGEKATVIITYSPSRQIEVTDKVTGEKKMIWTKSKLGTANVFNIDQFDNLDIPKQEQKPMLPASELEQHILDSYKDHPPIDFVQMPDGEPPHYSPSEDRITMPNRNQFDSEEEFLRTLLHELAHSTGHETRLDRKELWDELFIQGNHASRGHEELIAEISSAMMAAHLGIKHNTEKTSAYVKSWLQALQNDKGMILVAATAASQVLEYILEGRKPYGNRNDESNGAGPNLGEGGKTSEEQANVPESTAKIPDEPNVGEGGKTSEEIASENESNLKK